MVSCIVITACARALVVDARLGPPFWINGTAVSRGVVSPPFRKRRPRKTDQLKTEALKFKRKPETHMRRIMDLNPSEGGYRPLAINSTNGL